jgi:hypothetical protein
MVMCGVWDECRKGKWGLKELLTAKNAKNAAKSAKRSAFMAKGTKKQRSWFHVSRRAPGLRFSRLGPGQRSLSMQTGVASAFL